MKIDLFVGVVLLWLFRIANAVGLFKCPRQSLTQNFDINKFMGRWYEIERSFNVLELTMKCLTIDIELNKRGQIVIISRSINKWSGAERISEGIGVPGRRDPSIYQYKTASVLPTQLRPTAGTYQVLDTDYTNYAIIWSCSDYSLFYRDFIWIWGRHEEIDVNTRAKLYNFLTKRDIDTERLLISGSKNCTVS